MCNLSEGIEEKGRVEGEAGLIQKMYKNGMTAEQIASAFLFHFRRSDLIKLCG